MTGRRRPLQPEVARKAIHLIAGSLPLMYAGGVGRGALIGLLGLASTVALGIEWARRTWSRAQRLFERVMGPMLRKHEHEGVTGATWLVLTSLAAVLYLDQKPAVAALWCATVADPVAGMVGRAWHRLPPRAGKTWAGSTGCLVVAFLGAWRVAGYAPGPALAIAGTAMLMERHPGPFDDNLTVPVGVALMASAVA